MNNIRNLRKRKGLTQQELGDAIGVTKPTISNYESGKRQLTADILQKLAQFFGVSTDEILGRAGDNSEPFGRPIVVKPELTPEDEIMIPVVASLRCGYNYSGDPYTVIKKVPVPKSYIARWGKNLVAMEAVGKSMMPTIRPGDLMICIPGDAWEDNQIIDIDINDSDTIKRIFRNKQDSGIDLVPDNEEYEPMHYTPEDLALYQARILGRIVKTIPPDL